MTELNKIPETAMLTFMDKSKIIGLALAAIAVTLMLAAPNHSLAQERYPAVARISFVSGPVTYSRGDDPNEWDDALQNVPLAIGDRIYTPAGGRIELQLSSGNLLRLAQRTYFSILNLSDDVKQFYLGEGVASFNIRRLQSDEVIEIDTPNVSVTLDEPGHYRIAVDENGDGRITVRRGRVTVAANGRQIAVENSEIRIYGIDSPRYEIVGLPASDAFDRWTSERDNRFDRGYADAYRYASDEIIGVEDLSDYGRWEQIPEYGYAWTPAIVAVGWLPFSNGRWFWQDPWGWTWISNDRWGWATSHYGRWTQYRSRWYWVPVRPRTRVIYAPACVEFVRVRDHVGWFPLHPRDRYIPWWDRRDRFDRNVTYVNRNYVTIVNQTTFISARPVNKYIVRDPVVVRDARTVPFRSAALPIPNRSSLRIISESGSRGFRPPVNVVNRTAVVRTAPPLPPPTFQQKLPQIQKSDGKPVAPSQAGALASATDKTRAERIRFRPAAEEKGGRDFAARNPAVKSGPAPQPITAARGKKLATQDSAATQSLSVPAGQKVGAAGQPDASVPEQERERQRQQKQISERERQAQQEEVERRKQEQHKGQQRKATLQEPQPQLRLQEQEQRELQRSKTKEPKQELKRESSAEQQRLEELERRKAQREEERKAQALQQQQEQARREQARRQQLEEHQALQQQKQRETEHRPSEPSAKQQPNQNRAPQRQQQLQERQTQQQQPAGRQPEPQKQVERKASPLQQPPTQP